MSLSLLDIHGDIEGDYDTIVDFPRNVTNGEILKALFPKDFDGTKAVIKEADWWNSPYAKGENK